MISPFSRLRATLARLKNHEPSEELALSDYPLDLLPDFPEIILKKGDHLALCGDSLTEQRMYSVLIESYLTACRPDLEINVRQFGWSGEKAGKFLARQHNDVLRFRPTVATVLYGMNDFRYMPYAEEIAAEFRQNLAAIVQNFHATDCQVLLGSPPIIGAVPDWVKTARGSKFDLNLALCRFRNITAQLASESGIAFADHFRPMLEAHFTAVTHYGPPFQIAGEDGVHPDWAGQAIIGWGFLKKLGLARELATITLDAASGAATASNGHEILSHSSKSICLRSIQLPFSPGPGPLDDSSSLRAGMALVPFESDLNRFTFRLTNPQATAYDLTWGEETRRYSADDLAVGISLTEEFQNHPLVPAFQKIWTAVAAKQAYETRQHKEFLTINSADYEAAVVRIEENRARYVSAISAAQYPVIHEFHLSAV